MESDDDKTRTHVVLTKDTMVSHYRVIEKIGAGGMGEVYLAEDTELDRNVALKFLPTHLCQDQDCRERFKREAQATAKLSHPNVVTIFEVSEFQGRPFFAMELVEGRSLREFSVGKDPSIEQILELGIQICEGLNEAHEKGVTHRDIKPSNILIDSHGRAKIVDFGLASVVGTDQLTKTGSTLGTIGYMSPEQVRGGEIDQRSDLFSIGVVLYELIAKQNPFKRDSEAATLKAVSDDTPHPVARFRADVPDGLQAIIDKVLEKDVKTDGGIYDKQYRNYSTAVGLLAFTAAGKAEYQSIIDNARKFLVKFQLDEGEDISPQNPFYGGIGYGGDVRPDLSNTHLALEAIKAAEEFDVASGGKIKRPDTKQDKKKEQLEPHWRKAMVFLSRTQNIKSVNDMDYATNDGGFIYETGHYTPERSISYGSMTYAGLKSLLFAGIDKNDIRVKKAYAWICNNYTVEENPKFGKTSLYYYFMTATKCLTAFGGDTVIDSKGRKHYWREDFLKKIISLQNEDGYWVNPDGRYRENIKDLATSYSVIAIKHALHEAYYNYTPPKHIFHSEKKR